MLRRRECDACGRIADSRRLAVEEMADGVSGPVGPDGWLVRSSGAVEVFGFHHHIEGLPNEEPFGFEVDALGKAVEAEGHEDFDAGLLNALVFGCVFAFEVGIDRYLRAAASTDRWDVVDRHTSAAVADKFERLLTQGNLHGRPPPFLVGLGHRVHNPSRLIVAFGLQDTRSIATSPH